LFCLFKVRKSPTAQKNFTFKLGNNKKALKEAAEVIAESPSALQLRYLQTLNSISVNDIGLMMSDQIFN
uniref:Uncharacterized protein n=1 Tax=Parascaris equorum TaxID=6256 RepID=A0A914RIY1_PAREQ